MEGRFRGGKVAGVGRGLSFKKKMSIFSLERQKEKFQEYTHLRPEGVRFRNPTSLVMFSKEVGRARSFDGSEGRARGELMAGQSTGKANWHHQSRQNH